ncbi:energy-coupling factor transporter transmembrane component T family protein [Corynebacterium mendelii]|uniref:Energy-coupling factor transporter transmembrane protein EcfT n=1 Tax=Corynebacterium mendelii TaxID=2765362 RepID=A0A939ITG2_9CORY|nr:hypothetical protein [Corynebacterium mendelii]
MKPITIGVLIVVYTAIVFFSSTLLYVMMLALSFMLLGLLRGKTTLLAYGLAYGVLYAGVRLTSELLPITGWIGSVYTMALIAMKLYPLWMLAAVQANYDTSVLIHSLKKLRLPTGMCIAVAVFFRFVPEYKRYLLAIREGMRARNITPNPMHPVGAVELFLVPLIYKALETGEMLTCALITKGIDYDCEKTSYVDLGFSWRDALVLAAGFSLAGGALWQNLSALV